VIGKPSVPGFISEEDQAKRAGVSLTTQRRWRKTGYGPRAVRYGRAWLYPENSDARFLAEQAAASENQHKPRSRGRPKAG